MNEWMYEKKKKMNDNDDDDDDDEDARQKWKNTRGTISAGDSNGTTRSTQHTIYLDESIGEKHLWIYIDNEVIRSSQVETWQVDNDDQKI